MDINKVFNSELEKFTNSGELEKMTQTAIKNLSQSIIDDILGRYGELGKQLKQKLVDNLKIGIENVDINAYSKTINVEIEKILQETVFETSVEKIKKTVCKIASGVEKKRYKLSEIIEEIKDFDRDEDSEKEYGELNVEKRQTRSSTWVDISTESGKTFKLSIDNKDGKIWYLDIDDRPVNLIKNPFELTHSIEGFLFNLYANECTVEIDSFDAEWSNEPDY